VAVVITTLLNGAPDPQRDGERWPADVHLLDELRASVHRHGHQLVVLTDCLDEPDDALTTFVRVASGANPYFHRWQVIADFIHGYIGVLGDAPGFVWCVDGTDVEMLHDPFPHMVAGVRYCGSESSVINFWWMVDNHPSVRDWLNTYDHLPLLNAGLLGGTAAGVWFVAATLATLSKCGDMTDMGQFNRIVHNAVTPVVTGPEVHTELRAFDRDSSAWWRHK